MVNTVTYKEKGSFMLMVPNSVRQDQNVESSIAI